MRILPKKANESARRVHRLAKPRNATRYLEVGVARGETFFAVDLPHKVAVDPHLQFDYAALETETTRYHNITSDDYFLNHAKGAEFDVIFLDGLHTFEQTFRDFCASFAHAHRKTVWMIDDTVPVDVYSAMPDLDDSLRFRTDSRTTHKSWHGDVYKIVFALHDFFPSMSYATANDGENAQTIVWFEPRAGFKPLFNSLEPISRLSYFDFRKNEAVMKYDRESAIMERVAAAK